MTPSVAGLSVAAVAGLALGSFAVTHGLRLSRGGTALAGRSRCDGCGRPLSFAATIPLVAYARLRGACAACGGRIDPLHPAGEGAGAVVVAGACQAGDPLRVVLVAALGLALIAAATVDLKVRRLPDALTGVVALLALALAASRSTEAVLAGLAAGAASVAILLGLRAVGQARRGEPGLGLGDVKLVGAASLWLGVSTPWAIIISALLGLATMAVLRPADGRAPFGPALAAGFWLTGATLEARAWPTTM